MISSTDQQSVHITELLNLHDNFIFIYHVNCAFNGVPMNTQVYHVYFIFISHATAISIFRSSPFLLDDIYQELNIV